MSDADAGLAAELRAAADAVAHDGVPAAPGLLRRVAELEVAADRMRAALTEIRRQVESGAEPYLCWRGASDFHLFLVDALEGRRDAQGRGCSRGGSEHE